MSRSVKIPTLSPGLIFVQNAFLADLLSGGGGGGGAYFQRGLLSQGVLRFKTGLACQ